MAATSQMRLWSIGNVATYRTEFLTFKNLTKWTWKDLVFDSVIEKLLSMLGTPGACESTFSL